MIREVTPQWQTTSLIENVATAQNRAVGLLPAQRRGAMGQFMTPASVAALMASFMPRFPTEVRLLDAGAGCGALTAAFVAEACRRTSRPSRINVVAYELEESLGRVLRDTLRECGEVCARAGVRFEQEVRMEDFIESGTRDQREVLFTTRLPGYTHAILNPPYRKLRSDSDEKRRLREVGIEATNLYAAFVSLALRLLGRGGQLVAITPRSFCNGPYFRPFREELLRSGALRRIHVFRRRDAAFDADSVLQENVILHLTKGATPSSLVLSTCDGPNAAMSTRRVPFSEVVNPQDRERFIHVPVEADDRNSAESVRGQACRLDELGIQVSTGRVVDFRARPLLRRTGAAGSVPLIWACHLKNGRVQWPVDRCRKPESIVNSQAAAKLLVPAGYYVLVKRFSAKEEPRRIVAAVLAPGDVDADSIGLENHLNYFHRAGQGLNRDVAHGLAAYLNSDAVDAYFRQFNGHTQVNATDLRSLRYPSLAALARSRGRTTAAP